MNKLRPGTALAQSDLNAKGRLFPRLLGSFLVYAILLVLFFCVLADSLIMNNQLIVSENKVADSASIQMFQAVDKAYLEELPTDKRFTIYRDWKAYVEPQENWRLKMSWNLIDYATLGESKPDILFLERSNINFFSDPEKVVKALSNKTMDAKYGFYSDAKTDSITGYTLIYESDFGQVYVSDQIYLDYFIPQPE
jgi:hypothetical protein